jgi:hypothetical protein
MRGTPYRIALIAAGWCLASACSSESSSKSDATSLADSKLGDSSSEVSQGDAGSDSKVDSGDGSTTKAVLTPRPLRFEENLNGVWGSSPSDMWIVGNTGRLLHWNGKVLLPRNPGTNADLYGAGGTGPSDVWFVGSGGKALHWNGATLSDQSPAVGDLSLRAVGAAAGSATVLVAGDAGTVYRWQEGGWKPENTKSSFNLRSIAVGSSGTAWAVGDQGVGIKLSGGSWTSQALPKANVTLRAVAVSPGGRWYACGDTGYLAATTAGTWEATLANDTQARDTNGLWAVSDTEAWSIGQNGVLLHLMGKKWQLDDIAGTYMKDATLRAMWGHAGDGQPAAGFAVGDGGSGVQFDPITQTWQDFRAETTADLRQVTAMADGSVYTCGSGGAVLRADDRNAPFYDLAAPVTAADLWDCTASGSDLWVGGDAGLAAHWSQAGGWKVESAGVLGAVTGVAVLSDGVLVVSDDGSAARRKADGTWVPEKTVNQLPLRSLAVAGGQAWAVGDVGTVLHRDASGTWTPEAVSETGDLHRVIAWGDGEAMAVGDFGAIWVRSKGTWTKAFEAPELPLYGATRKDDGTLIAVGWQAALVVQKPGGAFALVPSQTAGVLRGVVATKAGTLAVGMKGAVFGVAEVLP